MSSEDDVRLSIWLTETRRYEDLMAESGYCKKSASDLRSIKTVTCVALTRFFLNFRLDLSIEGCRLESFAWKPSLGNLRLINFVWVFVAISWVQTKTNFRHHLRSVSTTN